MDDEVDSITFIQKTIILLSNEVVEKRGELDNTKKIIKEYKTDYNKEFRDFNGMSKLISREEKLLEEVDKKISKININMKIKLNSINSEFLKILCDFMSRTNQDVSNAIMEFLGFLKSPYVCLKNILKEEGEFASLLENSVNYHKTKFNTDRQMNGGTEYALYLIGYKNKLELLIKENKDWMEYPANIIIEFILMEFDLFSLFLEREKTLSSIDNLQTEKNKIFIGLKNLESEILKNDAIFRNFSRYIKSINIIFDKYMYIKESTNDFSSIQLLQEHMPKINEFAENLKEFKKSNFINLLRKYDNMNSLTLKSEYSDDVTEILPDEITKAVNQSTYNPITNTGYVKNSSTDNINNNILYLNMDNQSQEISEKHSRNPNINLKEELNNSNINYNASNKKSANCTNSVNQSNYFNSEIELGDNKKQTISYIKNTNVNGIGKINKSASGLINNGNNSTLNSQNIISKLRGNSNILEMNKKKNMMMSYNSYSKGHYNNKSSNKLKKSIASETFSNTNTINNNCILSNGNHNNNNGNSKQTSVNKNIKKCVVNNSNNGSNTNNDNFNLEGNKISNNINSNFKNSFASNHINNNTNINQNTFSPKQENNSEKIPKSKTSHILISSNAYLNKFENDNDNCYFFKDKLNTNEINKLNIINTNNKILSDNNIMIENLMNKINQKHEEYNSQVNMDENMDPEIYNDELINKDKINPDTKINLNEKIDIEALINHQGINNQNSNGLLDSSKSKKRANHKKNNLLILSNCEHFENVSDELITSPLNRIPVRTSKLISEKPSRAKNLGAVPDLFNLKIDKNDVKSVGGCCVSCV